MVTIRKQLKKNLPVLRFGASKDFLCRKIKCHLMKNREEWKDAVRKRQNRMEAWMFSCLSVEELLCLQLLGYSPKQLYEAKGYSLKETVAMSIRELDKAKRILDRQAKAGVVTIPYYNEAYPHHFRHLREDAPPLIHVLGNKDLPNREDNVAIIGARAADKEGLNMAYEFAEQMGKQGHIVISGLALGCDTAAHRGCLDADGQTIAVVASGLDITHPKVNKSLQDEIIANGGAILSEHPFGVRANPTRLVARCRMQVVLTQSVIVAQCPIISGTMYAVCFAQAYNDDLFGWEHDVYAVRYDTQNELNSGNKFLLDYNLALPVRPGQEIILDNYNRLFVCP